MSVEIVEPTEDERASGYVTFAYGRVDSSSARVFQSDQLAQEEAIYQLRSAVQMATMQRNVAQRAYERASDKRRAYRLQLKRLNKAHRQLVLEHRAALRQIALLLLTRGLSHPLVTDNTSVAHMDRVKNLDNGLERV